MTAIRTRGPTTDVDDLPVASAIDLDRPAGGVVGFVGPLRHCDDTHRGDPRRQG